MCIFIVVMSHKPLFLSVCLSFPQAVLAVGGGHSAHTHCKFSKNILQQIKVCLLFCHSCPILPLIVQVFGQVDRKFIACLLEAQDSSRYHVQLPAVAAVLSPLYLLQ